MFLNMPLYDNKNQSMHISRNEANLANTNICMERERNLKKKTHDLQINRVFMNSMLNLQVTHTTGPEMQLLPTAGIF